MAPKSRDDDPFAFLERAEIQLTRGDVDSGWLSESPELGPEDTIDDRWIIKTRIGRGAFGVVFEAECIDDPEHYVAIKVVPIQPDDRWEARFDQEADVTVNLCHPNVVRTHSHGRIGHATRYLVMELLEGETLAERLSARVGLSWPEVAYLCNDLGAALGHTHANGIVHRDVKPGNVFLADRRDASVQIKLIDFGLCKGATPITASRERLGTLAYMPPEALIEGSQTVTPLGDVYGMALTIYAAITGQTAFPEAELPHLLARICHGPAPTPLTRFRPDAPAELQHALACGFNRRAECRPTDAAAFGARLAEAITRAELTTFEGGRS